MPLPFASVTSIPLWPKLPTTSRARPSNRTHPTARDGFGLPSPDDPDPFGVLALEKAGLVIREAGTKSRPDSEEFEYRPSPTSPAFRHSIQSNDGSSLRNLFRHSRHSRRNSRRSVTSVDQGTQTADLPPLPPSPSIEEPERSYYSPQRSQSVRGREVSPPRIPRRNHSLATKESENLAWVRDDSMAEGFHDEPDQIEDGGAREDAGEDAGEGEEEEEEEHEECDAVIAEAAPAVQIIGRSLTSPMTSKARIVTIGKRIPPALPARNPLRGRGRDVVVEEAVTERLRVDEYGEVQSASSASPTKSETEAYPWSEQTSLPDTASVKTREETKPSGMTLSIHNSEGIDEIRSVGKGLRISTELGEAGGMEHQKIDTPLQADIHAILRRDSFGSQESSHTNGPATIQEEYPRSRPTVQNDTLQYTGSTESDAEERGDIFHSIPSTPLERVGRRA
jgi:hypothetical protein